MANIQAIFEQFMKLKGANERLQGLTNRHDIYPAIDPQSAFSSKSFAGKVVLITGPSKGLGPVIATFYARAGAKLALVARTASALDSVKKQIKEAENSAEVLTFTVDVKDTAAAAKVVQDTVDRFGRIDVVVANAGVTLPNDGVTVGDRDVGQWWNTMEVNLLGTLNFVAPSLKHLSKVNGYVVAISSMGAQLRNLGASDYGSGRSPATSARFAGNALRFGRCALPVTEPPGIRFAKGHYALRTSGRKTTVGVSKFALNRLIEFIALEYSNVPAFAIHPGAVWTEMAKGSGLPKEIFLDTPELASATILTLTSGKYDWLRGRFIDSTIDLGELEQLKDKILEKDALVAKLVLL